MSAVITWCWLNQSLTNRDVIGITPPPTTNRRVGTNESPSREGDVITSHSECKLVKANPEKGRTGSEMELYRKYALLNDYHVTREQPIGVSARRRVTN